MSDILTWSGIVLQVALGLGAVIFVHELGHFLVAKACGVKCEKFFIGFDVGGYKLSRKWGETEYGIGILPLGGYVKMLGQDDNPSAIDEQMERSQIDPDSPDAKMITGPDGQKYVVDCRSYLAKSVPQRMAIISAGVIMNVIFAFVFAVVAFGLGVPYTPAIVSETVPGSPAWVEGIEPGSEIIKIASREEPSFEQLSNNVILGDLKNGLPVVIRQPDGVVREMVLTPSSARPLATIGVRMMQTLMFNKNMPALEGSVAAAARLIEGPEGATAAFQGGDVITHVNGEPVENYLALQAILAARPAETFEITVRRTGAPAAGGEDARVAENLTFAVEPEPLRRLGLVMEMGPITAIRKGSPAAEAGLRAGDRIVLVDGQAIRGGSAGAADTGQSAAGWDPLTLPDHFRRAALEGRSVTLTIDRPQTMAAAGDNGDATERPSGAAEARADSGPDSERVEILVSPRVPDGLESPIIPGDPLSVPAIGIAYRIENVVSAVVPDSPAAGAGIKPGDKVVAANFEPPAGSKQRPLKKPIEFGPENPNWPVYFMIMQSKEPGTKAQLTIDRGGQTREVSLLPESVEGEFLAERGLVLDVLTRTRQAESIGEAVSLGWDRTSESLTMVYTFLRKLGTQVPFTALGGPVTIARAAGAYAFEGMGKFLVFLTILSANLAVINFLPIPMLDGGHMVFLAYEGIVGRPASEKFVMAMHMAGLAFILGIMLFVTGLDVGLIPRNL